MKLISRRYLLPIILIMAILSVEFGMINMVSADSSETPITNEVMTTADNKYPSQSLATVDSGSMTAVYQNDSEVLYVDMATGEFAIQNKIDNYIWYSNPIDRESDPYLESDRANVFSTLTLHCLNTETMVDEYINSFGSAVLDENVVVNKTENGIIIEYKFEDYDITIPLKIVLTNDGFEASVDVSSIKEEGTYVTMDISLLPYFGAGGVKDEGYLIVPDGSGALIYFNNGKQNLSKYSNTVYGKDSVLSDDSKGTNRKLTAIPLFGLKNGNHAFSAIITEGDAVAMINAGVSKAGSGYNNIYSNFTLRSSGSDTIGGKEIRTYEKGKSSVECCEITYSFLDNDNADYVGVACVYRDYLEKRMKVSAAEQRQLSLFLELYGAVRIKKSVLGFPAKVIKPLTTFEQAEEIIVDLKSSDVDNILVAYQNADDFSLQQKVPTSYRPSSKLGGKKGYQELCEQLNKSNVPLISNIDLTTFQSSGNGFSVRTDTAKLFTGLPGLRYFFKINTGKMSQNQPTTYFLAPKEINNAATKFLKKYDTEKYGYIGLDTMATEIYSDFRKNGVNRQEMLKSLANTASMLSEKSPLYIRGGNGQLLPFTSYIYDLPSDCSFFDLIDESIPLYPIAVSGLVPYSLESVNSEMDANKRVLKCAEYGADLKFNFSYTDFGIIGDETLGYLNGSVYSFWKEYVSDAYKEISVLNGQIGNGKIIDHDKVADNVYITSYENGAKIIVNYNETEIVYDNIRVQGEKFAVLNGGKESA